MNALVKGGATLLLLTAIVGMVGRTANGLVREARGVLDQRMSDLDDLQRLGADLGVPP